MDFSRDGKKKARVSMCPKKFRADVSMDDSIPEWAQVLQPVRNLPTDSGPRILKCISEALKRNPPKFAKMILEHAISERVYKANASELTKNMVIILLAYAVEQNNLRKRKPEMVKTKTNVLRIEEPKPMMIEEPEEMMIDEEFEQLIYEANQSLSNEEETVGWKRMVEIVCSSDPPASTSVEHDFKNISEPVREMDTNSGDVNYCCVDPAFDNNPPNSAKEMLEHSVASDVMNMVEAHEGPSTELDFMKARAEELQQKISYFHDNKDKLIEDAKKEAVEAFKNSDEFRHELINAITQSFGATKS